VLDAAAPQVAGRMAIGKIDCTEEKKLCDEFKVRGYPTLKFSLDGEIYDYPLGRTEEEIVGFADRLTRPPIKLLDTVDKAVQHTREETYGHGVSFVCHDPKAPAGTVEKMAESSPLVQVCAQAARKQMAHAHFTLLKANSDVSTILAATGRSAPEVAEKEQETPEKEVAEEKKAASERKEGEGGNESETSEGKVGNESETSEGETGPEEPAEEKKEDVLEVVKEEMAAATASKEYPGFVCRLEVNVAPRCLYADSETFDTSAVLEFVKVNNVATVTQLGPQNFHHIGRIGRPLVIGVADTNDEEMLDKLKADLTSFALNSPAEQTEKYFFGWMDGQKWSKFLQQFDIKPEELPQVFVLDVPERIFWQDSSYREKPLEEFMAAVADGKIKSQQSAGVRGGRFLNRIAASFFNWMPWSLLLILGIATGVVLLVVPDAKDLRPPFLDKQRGSGDKPAQAPVDTLLGQKKDN
jgi:hypothetical protein